MALKLVVFHIQNQAGKSLAGAHLEAESQIGSWEAVTNLCGDCFTQLAPAHYELQVTWLNLSRKLPVDIGECTPENEGSGVIVIHLEPTSNETLERLVTRGGYFQKSNGALFTAVEASDFNLFGRYIKEGPNVVKEVLEQRRSLGFNMLRVWTSYSGGPIFESEIGRLLPNEYPHMYELIPQFCLLCGNYGLYVEFTAFTAEGNHEHWRKLGDCLQNTSNVIVELVNENDSHHPNVDDIYTYDKIPNILCSRGSNGSEKSPIRNPYDPPLQAGKSGWWDYEAFHTNDASEWQRKVGHNAMEYSDGATYPDGSLSIPASHVPILSNENTRYPDKSSNPTHAFDAAAGAALLCAGSCFHSVNGKCSQLWIGNELACAQQWAWGANSVPLEFQDGRYIRHEPGEYLRVYERRLSDGRGHIVNIHK